MASADEKSGSHPGMMGDGTEEQNLGQKGNPDARISKDEVEAAFGEDDKAGKDSSGKSDTKPKQDK